MPIVSWQKIGDALFSTKFNTQTITCQVNLVVKELASYAGGLWLKLQHRWGHLDGVIKWRNLYNCFCQLLFGKSIN